LNNAAIAICALVFFVAGVWEDVVMSRFARMKQRWRWLLLEIYVAFFADLDDV
jgi:hypothetical protein